MRLRLRLLGADVFEVATGKDAADEAAEDEPEAGPGASSPDLSVSTWKLTSSGFPVDDEPVQEDRGRT